MSVSFKLDENNNILFGSDIMTISGTEALIQDVKTRLSMLRGEYPFNINEGIDYFYFMQTGDTEGLAAAIQRRLLADDRIARVTFEKNKIKNTLIIRIVTTAGEEVSIELDA